MSASPPSGGAGSAIADVLARVLGEQGFSRGEVDGLLVRPSAPAKPEAAPRAGEGDSPSPTPRRPNARPSEERRLAARAAAERITARFPGKLQTAAALIGDWERKEAPATASAPKAAELAAPESAREGATGGATRHAHGPRTRLTRPERRVLRKVKRVQVDLLARRFAAKDEGHGVWSREVYRRIRAGVQDTSGKAAECLLFMMGTEEAARIAAEVDTRVPMDRRRVALAYAIQMAPGSEISANLKLGFAMGLWSAVLADPNNPNMERVRAFRPSRRTLSSDLNWLEGHKVVRRWQVPAEAAHPVEMKQGPYPTNRYFCRETREGYSLFAIAVALGDTPPKVTPNPDEAWTAEDALAIERLREALALELGRPVRARPPDPGAGDSS